MIKLNSEMAYWRRLHCLELSVPFRYAPRISSSLFRWTERAHTIEKQQTNKQKQAAHTWLVRWACSPAASWVYGVYGTHESRTYPGW